MDAIGATFWVMIFLQTIGSLDMPGSGGRKLPAPRAYMATIVIWSVLQLVSDTGHEKPATSMAWLTVLTALVLGPFGKKLADFFNHVADIYGAPEVSTAQGFESAFGPSLPGTPTVTSILQNIGSAISNIGRHDAAAGTPAGTGTALQRVGDELRNTISHLGGK